MINYRLYNKDCRSMSELPDESVQMVCTSPPYWGLRKYSGEQELIWGPSNCNHQWQPDTTKHDNLRFRDEHSIVGNERNRDIHPVDSWKDCEHQWASSGKLSLGRNDQDRNTRNVDGRNPDTQGLVGCPKQEAYSGGFCSLCSAWKGAYGLEPTPEMYIQHTIEILREIRRVLRKDGVVFWNIGDSYASGKGSCFNPGGGENSLGKTKKAAGAHPLHRGNISDLKVSGLKPKDLCLIPFRVAIAAQEDGWWVRSVIIWSKPNPMPESVNGWRWEQHRILVWPDGKLYKPIKGVPRPKEVELQDCPSCPKCSPNDGYVLRKGSWRPTDSYEHILMLTKSDTYYGDADAVREPYQPDSLRPTKINRNNPKGMDRQGVDSWLERTTTGRNLRNVWSFSTIPFSAAHFAVYPEKLPELCIKAATPEVGVCAECGAPWTRVVENIGKVKQGWGVQSKIPPESGGHAGLKTKMINQFDTLGWRPTCSCNCPDTIPATVLDPCAGAGTTLLVAIKLGRNAVGYELSSEYCDMTNKRINNVQIRYS